MTGANEPPDDADASVDPFDLDDDDETAPVPSWLGAFGEMTGALLVVLAVVAAFIAAAVVVRRLWP